MLSSLLSIATLPGSAELLLLTYGCRKFNEKKPEVNTGAFAQTISTIVVIIPAHNESKNITQVLQSLQACSTGNFKVELVVIADNCTDDTAKLAQSISGHLPLTVFERHHGTERGKGYALAYAIEKVFKDTKVSHVIIVDADAVVDSHFLISMASMFERGADAVQGKYLVKNPHATERTRLFNIAAYAFNVVRPKGRAHFGWSVGILGNGFGLSRSLLDRVPYHAYSIVEDLEYHLRVVDAGGCVQYCDEAVVLADAPTTSEGTATQRSRWEGGRFAMMREHLPDLIRETIVGKKEKVEPALELSLLPLGFHATLVALLSVLPSPLMLLGFSEATVLAYHLQTALTEAGATEEDKKVLRTVPRYILKKLFHLPQTLLQSKSNAWVRTQRD